MMIVQLSAVIGWNYFPFHVRVHVMIMEHPQT